MTTDAPRSNDVRALIQLLWSRRWLVLGVALGVTLVALAVDLVRDPSYTARAEVLLQSPATVVTTQVRAEESTQIDTELRILGSRSVEARATDELGFEPAVAITALGESRVASVSATAGDAAEAARIANTYVEAYVDLRTRSRTREIDEAIAQVTEEIEATQQRIDDLRAPIAELDERIGNEDDPEVIATLLDQRSSLEDAIQPQVQSLSGLQSGYQQQINELRLARSVGATDGAQVISEAEAPDSPSSPKPLRDAVAAIVLGLLAGAGVALLLERLDDSVRTPAQVEAAAGAPLIGRVPRINHGPTRGLVTITDPRSAAAEAFRSLRTSLQFLAIDSPMRALHITSPEAGAGKSTVVANLAVAAAAGGRMVVVVEADLRRPELHRLFNLSPSIGLTSVLLGQATLDEALQSVEGIEGLRVLTSGPLPPNPAELLGAEATQQLLGDLREGFELVLVDGPPVLPVADSRVIAQYVDATVLVAARGRTTVEDLRHSREALEQVGASIIGVVLNQVTGGTGSHLYYGPDDAPPNRRSNLLDEGYDGPHRRATDTEPSATSR